MARPIRGGVDYFSLDCNMDDKIKLIEAEFGVKGFAVVVKLYQKIYGGFGYYCEFTNEVELLFSRECGLGNNFVSEIVAASIKRGLFDKTLFEKYHILTSVGIQKRYFEMVSRRKSVDVIEQHLLIDVHKYSINVNINSINADINPENVNRSTQSKGKESKGKKSNICSSFERFWNAYPKKKGKANAEKAFIKLNPDDDLLHKMLKAVEAQKVSEQWQKENGQFIPYPASWLNGKRWEDEVEVKYRDYDNDDILPY